MVNSTRLSAGGGDFGYAAAVAAGYTPNIARAWAFRLLKDAAVVTLINGERNQHAQRLRLAEDRIMIV